MAETKEKVTGSKALAYVQKMLRAPKDSHNDFGNYSYRSAEGIYKAVKPLLDETDSLLTLSDDIVQVGDRIYVEAVAVFRNGDFEQRITAFAREDLKRSGMSDSQITGAASSYARKCALGGLFLIDDTKDVDDPEYTARVKEDEEADAVPREKRISLLEAEIKRTGSKVEKILEMYKVSTLSDIANDDRAFNNLYALLKKGRSKN